MSPLLHQLQTKQEVKLCTMTWNSCKLQSFFILFASVDNGFCRILCCSTTNPIVDYRGKLHTSVMKFMTQRLSSCTITQPLNINNAQDTLRKFSNMVLMVVYTRDGYGWNSLSLVLSPSKRHNHQPHQPPTLRGELGHNHQPPTTTSLEVG